MPKEIVLVPQPYGRACRRFIAALGKMEAKVVLLAPVAQRDQIPNEIENILHVQFADYADNQQLLDVVKAIDQQYRLTRVGVTWEFSIEIAARIRQFLAELHEVEFPGIRPGVASIFRDKREMGRFLKEQNIGVPDFCCINAGMCNEEILSVTSGMVFPAVLKPVNAAANIGVKKIDSAEALLSQVDLVRFHTSKCSFKEYGYDYLDEWLLSEFISGPEFEADLYIYDGDVRFSGIQEKTSLDERSADLVEIRTVTPSLRLQTDPQARETVENFVREIAAAVANLTGERAIMLYPEFRLQGNRCVCLEVAYRIGGTCFALERAFGFDPFDLAAAATLDRELEDLPSSPENAVSCQTLYSSHAGIFLGIQGLKHIAGTELEELMEPYHEIKSPHSEYVANVYATARSPEESEALLNEAVEKAVVATIVHSPQMITTR